MSVLLTAGSQLLGQCLAHVRCLLLFEELVEGVIIKRHVSYERLLRLWAVGGRCPKGQRLELEVRGSQGGLGRLEPALPDIDLVLFPSSWFCGQRGEPFAQTPQLGGWSWGAGLQLCRPSAQGPSPVCVGNRSQEVQRKGLPQSLAPGHLTGGSRFLCKLPCGFLAYLFCEPFFSCR